MTKMDSAADDASPAPADVFTAYLPLISYSPGKNVDPLLKPITGVGALVPAAVISDMALRRKQMQGEAVSWIVPGSVSPDGGETDWTPLLEDAGLTTAHAAHPSAPEGLRAREAERVFLHLHRERLLIRGAERFFYCPSCDLTHANGEIKYRETVRPLFLIRYRLARRSQEYITAPTFRPGTLFSDAGLLVNPGDSRFGRWEGEMVQLPLTRRLIPVMASKRIASPDFGAARLTPATNPRDYRWAIEKDLEFFPMRDALPDAYRGLVGEELDARVVADLKQQGLLEPLGEQKIRLPHCPQCRSSLEPETRGMWIFYPGGRFRDFLRRLDQGQSGIIPASRARLLLLNPRYWNGWPVSGGSPANGNLPVYQCAACRRLTVASDSPNTCPGCSGSHLTRSGECWDPRFLQAAEWLAGAPSDRVARLMISDSAGFRRVAPAIALALVLNRIPPFSDVMVSAVNSLAGGIPPVSPESVGDAGDALAPGSENAVFRFAAALNFDSGRSCVPSNGAEKTARALIRKMDNIARFITAFAPGAIPFAPDPRRLPAAERWILHRLNHTVEKLNRWQEDFQFTEAAHWFRRFTVIDFSRVYLPLARCGPDRPAARQTVAFVFYTLLQLAHPFFPGLTGNWSRIAFGQRAASPGDTPYPSIRSDMVFSRAYADMSAILNVIGAVRRMRHIYKTPGADTPLILLKTDSPHEKKMLENYLVCLLLLTASSRVEIVERFPAAPPSPGFRGSCPHWEILLVFAGPGPQQNAILKVEKELAELEQTIVDLESAVNAMISAELSNRESRGGLLKMKQRLRAALRQRNHFRKILTEIKS